MRPPADLPRNWPAFAPRFSALTGERLTPEAVAAWLEAWSELEKDVAESYAWLMRAKDENTGDEEAEMAFLHFVREVMPEVERSRQELRQALLAVEDYEPPPDQTQMLRHLRGEAALFREANVAVQAELEARANDFNKITGALTAELDGETLTLPQAQHRLREQDRALRERAWRAVAAAQNEVAPALDALLLELLPLRRRLAENADLRDYRAYRWLELGRFDYGPEDSRRLHEAIAAEVVPLLAERRQRRREALGVESLRPWDLQADPRGEAPLAPFSRVEELEEGLTRIFTALDPELGRQFASLRDGWLDLGSRRGKVPGLGYCNYFPRSGMPYIYHSAVGSHSDVWVMLHEAGHAFHSLAAGRAQRLSFNLHSGAEFAEVASQTMELLALPFLERDSGGFYSADEGRRAREEGLERVVGLLAGTAQNDAFQHWLYAEAPDDVSAADLDAKWLELSERFSPGVDWRGLELERARGWQVVHVFTWPLYMLDYAIAYLGALQLWRAALEDQEGALRRYREALALGGSRPLPELFAAAGARLAFDRETVRGLMAFLRTQF